METAKKKCYYILTKWFCAKFVDGGKNMSNINPALLVANNILEDAFKKGYYVSPMKLQKLLYFTYKKYIKDTKNPLFNENFEVWQYGPVLPSVYSEFRSYNKSEIRRYAFFGNDDVLFVSEQHTEIYAAIDYVLDKYRHYSAIDLSDLTHKDGTAWHKARTRNELYLEDDEIAEEAWLYE